MEPNNYPKNVVAFLGEINRDYKDCIEQSFEAEGSLYIAVCNETVNDFDAFISLRNSMFSLAEKFALRPYLRLSLYNRFKVVGFQLEISAMNKLVATLAEGKEHIAECNVTVDPEREHIELLKVAFRKITPDQIAQAVKFLLGRGWTKQRFMQEFDVDSVTLWRYQKRLLHMQQSNQVENGQVTGPVIVEEAPIPN